MKRWIGHRRAVDANAPAFACVDPEVADATQSAATLCTFPHSPSYCHRSLDTVKKTLRLCGTFGLFTVALFITNQSSKSAELFDWPLDSPMTFRVAVNGGNCSSCNWILAEGEIQNDTPEKFELFLAEQSMAGGVVRFNSPGGDLLAGLKLGELIRQHGFDTAVGKTPGRIAEGGVVWTEKEDAEAICASACVFAFAGGVRRYGVNSNIIGTTLNGRLGVHQFYDQRASEGIDKKVFDALDRSEDQVIVGLILEFLSRLNVSSDLMSIASSTPWQELHWLSDEELRSTRLDNIDPVYNARLVGYKNGVLTAVVMFETAMGISEIEFYCDAKKQMFLNVTLALRNPMTNEDAESWRFFEGLSLENGRRLSLMKRIITPRDGAGSTVSLTLRFESGSASDISQIRKFFFEDSSSRYAGEMARAISFELPLAFDGLYVVPRNCLHR
jgi:hypothetical protein